jgi:hypothetical protein
MPFGRASAAPGWRAPFGALWRERELARGAGSRDRREALRWAQKAVDTSSARLEALLEPGRPRGRGDFERCLGCAASVLEGCAHLAAAHTTGSGRGHLHLLRRLEHRLEESEHAVLRADGDYVVRPGQVGAAAERGALALHELARSPHGSRAAEREGALGALEDASVAFAALAIRAGLNVRGGRDPGGEGDPPAELAPRLDVQVDALAEAAAAARARPRRPARQAGAGGWLADALTTELPAAARGARRAGADAAARARMLGELRAAWLRLGARELLAVEEFDRAAAIPVFANRRAIRETLARQAAELVSRTRLAGRPQRFDHVAAWSRQRDDLAAAAESHGGRRRGGATARMTELTVLGALERCAAALWTVDAQLQPTTHDPTTEG